MKSTIAAVTTMSDSSQRSVTYDSHVRRRICVCLRAAGLHPRAVHHILNLVLETVRNVKVTVLICTRHWIAFSLDNLESQQWTMQVPVCIINITTMMKHQQNNIPFLVRILVQYVDGKKDNNIPHWMVNKPRNSLPWWGLPMVGRVPPSHTLAPPMAPTHSAARWKSTPPGGTLPPHETGSGTDFTAGTILVWYKHYSHGVYRPWWRSFLPLFRRLTHGFANVKKFQHWFRWNLKIKKI